MPTNAEVRTQKRIDAVKSVQRGEEPKLVARVMGIPMTTLYDWRHAIAAVAGMLRASVTSIGRLLRHLGLSPQSPIYKAYQQDKTAVKQWLEQTYPNLFARAKRLKVTLCFADEASFGSGSHRGTTWGAIGQTPIVEEHRGRFGINCISAISAKGEMRFNCFEGRMNSDGFIRFLKALHSDSGKPVFVIVDGASYHSSKQVKDYVKSTRGEVELFRAYPRSANRHDYWAQR